MMLGQMLWFIFSLAQWNRVGKLSKIESDKGYVFQEPCSAPTPTQNLLDFPLPRNRSLVYTVVH